jgi:DNA mismatch endonuclease (patch repair protein)
MSFWNSKLEGNFERDKLFRRKLRAKGWKVLVVWQCETRSPEKMLRRLERFLHDE